MKVRCFNIDWDTTDDDGNVEVACLGLPSEVFLEVDESNLPELADLLSDEYGFCVNTFEFEKQ